MKTDDLVDPLAAMEFYDRLLAMFPEPKKQIVVQYAQHLLLAGYNENKFGYRNRGHIGDPNRKYFEQRTSTELPPAHEAKDEARRKKKLGDFFLAECEANIDEMAALGADTSILADCYFLMGLMTSGSSIWSGSIKLNEESSHYFERVVDLTAENPVDQRRVFSSLWLAEFHAKQKD